MDNPELSMSTPGPAVPIAPVPASAYPSHTPAHSGENPFGEQPRRATPAGGLRKRISSALAAVAALFAKFFAAIKGVLLLLPKAKLLTTAGTALVSVVLYSLFWGWTFA